MGEAERVRKQIAGDLGAEIRALDGRLKSNERAMAESVEASGGTLTQTVGIGSVSAARLIGRSGRPNWLPTRAANATHTGRAGPGNGNSAPRDTPVAITQIRTTGSRGNAKHHTKIAEGETRERPCGA